MKDRNINREFPLNGNIRAKEASIFLGIAKSTFWRWVNDKKIKPAIKISSRVSVWDAEYIRDIAINGLKNNGRGET